VATKKDNAEDIFGDDAPAAPEPILPAGGSEAIAAIVQAEVAKALKAIQNGGGAVAPTSTESAQDLFRQMALSIAEMTHQGDKRQRPLDPKVMAAREEAKRQLDILLMDIRGRVHEAKTKSYASEADRTAAVRSVTPKYRAISKVHFDDRIIDPFRRNEATKRAEPIEFYWLQEPNDALRPMNPIAEEVFNLFRQSRGTLTKIEKAAVKPAWMTDGGLIIEGDKSPVRRGVESQAPLRDSALDIPGYVDPEAEFIHVLGTISDPAQQNHQGKPI